ncbi:MULTISPECIES: hypothetical protein [Campylobacter]|uniref:putative barnase/colicin E5 family endoribonuclease n=1 Tax=Campylobacter TaxID=194 RepID=UPI000A33A815|nr:hypothetical protein [Campylobacter sp. P0024]MCR8679592.1 hypothetical protein [Campylobacter sp. RM19072]
MAEIYTVRSILGDESLQNLINQGKSQDEIISIAKAYKDEAIKSGDKDALNRMNLVNGKQGRADFFTRLGDKMDANGYETMGSIARGIDILASKVAAPIAGLMGDSDKEAQILADMKLTQSINEAKNLDKIATTPRTQREYQIDSNNLLANAIGSYTKDSKTYARNLIEQAENSGYTAMDRFNIGMATTANATKYFIKSLIYGEDSKEARDIKDAQKILQASRDAYEANNPDKWNVANFAGEMVTDPLNAVGLAKGFKVANTAFKKGANVAFDLAQLGAIGGMAGAIMEYGSYKEKDEQNVAGAAMIGATSGVALGAGFMALGAVLNKIASRFGQKSTLEQNAGVAKDETTKELEKGTPQDIDKRLQKISDDIEEAFSADENAENIARLLGQEYDDNINKAIKESQEVSTAIDDSVAKFANDNPKASASDIEIYINKTYAPSQSEKELTRIINDDKPVTPRMAGYRVLGVLQKTMEYKTRFDRDTIVKRFKNHGFSDELANIFADAYIADDISVARRYLDSKVASNRQKSVEDGRNEWLENTTKSDKTKTPKNQDEILKEISSNQTQFKLIDDSDMTPELKSRLENDGYTLERESESGVWEISKAISNEDIKGTDEALQNSTKDTPTPSTATKEVDNLSEATPNLTQNSIKGDGFVTYPNSARQETAINQNFNIQEWVKNMSGVISDEWRANLTKLAKKHPEMFRSEADVFRVIKEIKDNPTHFFKNYDDDVALIGKQINDNKFANIGIVKNDGEIIHANKNKIKDLDRLQRRNKEMLTGTPLPATTRANNSMGGDLLQHFNDKTIPNQSIKQAETAKEPNLSRAERRAMGIEEPKGKTLAQYRKDIEAKYNIRPIKEFGTNYAEFYHDGKGAIDKLLAEKQGQVAGAFERQEIGDIDLVWGEVTDAIKHKGYGLSHILDKRIYQYMQQGLSKEEAKQKAIELINKLPDIIKNGEIIKKPNEAIQIITDDTKIVLKSNYYGEPTNKWIVTAYERLEKDLDISAKPITKSTNPPLNSKPNSTPKEIKSQEPNLSRAERRAMGIEEPKGKTLVIDEKAVKSDVREFGRLADQVGLGFKSAKEAKAVMDKCDKSKFDCGS